MSRQSLALLLAITTLVVANGCCINRYGCGGYYRGGCSEYSENECCGSSCCEATPYRHCGRGSCLSLLAAPFRPLVGLMKCGTGCGEVYWGEWTSDPPDCCDPCDSCGNWVGDGCCLPRLQKLFWGRRYRCGSGYEGQSCGCDSCGGSVPHGPGCGCDSCSRGGPGIASRPGPTMTVESPRYGSISPDPPTESVLRPTSSTRVSNSPPGYTPSHLRR